MKRYWSLLLVIVFSLFFLTACKESQREKALERQKETLQKEKEAIEERIDIVEEQKEVAETQREVLEDQKELFRKKTGLRFDEFDTRMDVLRARAANAEEADKVNLNKEIDELEINKEAIHDKLDEMESVAVEGWDNFKLTVDAAISDLEQSYNRINSRLQ